MTTPSQLTASIREALAQAPQRPARTEPTPEQLRQDAGDALLCVEAVVDAIANGVQAVNTEPNFIGLILLRASCDQARAMLFLLSSNPIDMGASALGLHRAQIETFLRAVFFSQVATDEQLQDFLTNDKGPRQLTANNKWANITMAELAPMVQASLEALQGVAPGTQHLASMVATAWDPLCGMVHGGRSIHAVYVDGNHEIGCKVPAGLVFQATTNAVAISQLALATACTIGGWGANDENPALTVPGERFHAFIARHNARLRAVGMHELQRPTGAH